MPTTVSGFLKLTSTSADTSNVKLRFTLKGFTGQGPSGQQPQVPGIGLLGPTDNNGNYYTEFTPDGTGAVSGTLYSTRDATGLLAGDITIAGSGTVVWYDMQVITSGQFGPAISVHAKQGATLDPSNVAAISTPVVVAAPTGDTTYSRLDGSNQPYTASIQIPSTGVYKWSTDTGLSRDSAGVVDVGNGTQGDKSGTLQAASVVQAADASRVSASGLFAASNKLIGFSSTALSGGTPDAGISRTATNTLAIGNGSQGDITGNLQLGKITEYNSIFTAGIGTAPIYSIVSSTAQTASITSTTLYAVPSSGAGLYRVTYSLVTTTGGTGGTVTVTIGWNNGSGSQSSTSSTCSLSSLGTEISSTLALDSAASQNITYSTTVSGATGNPQYALRIRLEYLG